MKTHHLLYLAFLGISLSLNAQRTLQSLPLDTDTNCKIRYYYYPNLEAYYDQTKDVYIYKKDGQWTEASEIPSGYRGYSLFNRMNVPIRDYDDENPVQFLDRHRKLHPYNTLRRIKQMASNP